MAALHGHVGEFDGSREEWAVYAERLEHYFAANDVTAEGKKRAILFSVCGSTTYSLIRNLTSPDRPDTKTFAQLVELVKDHYQPKPSAIVMRFRFNSHVRQQGESVAQFVAKLRQLSEHCAYGGSLEEMLRDRLVCGISNESLQRRLLAEPDLTFKTAFDLAQAAESAEINAKALRLTTPADIHATWKPERKDGKKEETTCSRCGGKHKPAECRFINAECHSCGKRGHIARACRSRRQPTTQQQGGKRRPQRTNCLTEETSEALDTSSADYTMFQVTNERIPPLQTPVRVNDATLHMEVDTGASVSLISEKTYHRLWPQEKAPTLRDSTARLRTYTGEQLEVLGQISVTVQHKEQQADLNLLVVRGEGPSLLGRDWLTSLNMEWKELFSVEVSPEIVSPEITLDRVLEKHTDVFKQELGTVKGVTAKICSDPEAQPKFHRPRPVPYALRGRVEQELARLEQEGIMEPVEFADWAAPIVPVVKRDGTIRVCGDFKVTINQHTKVDTYPLPRIEDLFASLSGGAAFTKLDLAHAYQQLVLDDPSKDLATINTHKGLYRYNRLPFGVASAPAIFQRTMETILQGLQHVCVYIDDILVTGESETAHLENLEAVLGRLESAGVRLKREKCAFMLPEVVYLGHRISAQGLQPTQEKVRAIADAPTPKDATQLQAFLGLLNYYGKFLQNRATRLAPLHELLQKQRKWSWGGAQDKAFKEAKTLLISSDLLVHYDPHRELLLSCDASPYNVGAVLSHKMDDGTEKPVAFASRSLSSAEKNYSQLDKEALAIIFGVKHFHQYLFGRQFVILSDHQPLHHLLNASRSVPAMASARLQRWALTLGAYNYSIVYKPGSQHANADVLSWLPLPEAPTEVPLPGELVLLLENLDLSPVSASQIKVWVDKDPVLSRVRDNVKRGWRHTDEAEMRPFQTRRNELSVQDGCILWGSRVVVPQPGRERVMELLHEGHPGTARMKSLARGYVWWPGMELDLEGKVKGCTQCQQGQKLPAVAPLHPWEWPDRPWSRIHADYAGPFMGKMFLVVVDAHSKWLDVQVVNAATSQTTIGKMQSMFATHGLPEMVVTDNGSVFTSAEFETFMVKNGIRHVTSAPYHPATNGLAERAVQTLKAALKKSTAGSLETKVARFLFHYRLTPHSTTGISPAELLFGRRPRSHLDLLYPDVSRRVRDSQTRQKSGHDRRAKSRLLQVGDTVLVRNFASGSIWLTGTILRARGPVSFDVLLDDGREVRRHVDHLRARTVEPGSPASEGSDSLWDELPLDLPTEASAAQSPEDPTPQPRRSSRPHHPPDRYM